MAWGATALCVAAAAVVVARTRGGERLPAPPTVRAYATATGQRANITLADGTRVTLAPRSELRLSDFGAAARVVTLEGEAYFDVASAAGVPFEVRSAGTVTRVLGTTFVVRHYPDDRAVRVAVVTGKVAVAARARRYDAVSRNNAAQAYVPPQTTLVAGNVAFVSDSVVAVYTDDAQESTSWLNGRLVFRSAPASDVLHALTQWYGYQFRTADSAIVTQKLTLVLNTDAPAEALSKISLLLAVDLQVDGDVITLVPKRSHSAPAIPRRGAERTLDLHKSEIGR